MSALPAQVLTTFAPAEKHLFSPTQISTYLECPRKWAWRRIAKIYDPPAASAQLGTDTHALLEAYLGEGTMPDHVGHPQAAKVASAGLHLLPAPKTQGMRLESKFHFRSTRTGIVYGGLKDVELPPGVPVPSLELDGSYPAVLDHKTTSSIESYAKTPEDLLFDPQAITYAIDSLVRFDAEAADLRWVYYQTKGAHRSKVTAQRITAQHAANVFAAIESVAEEAVKALEAGAQPLDLAPNPSACSGFGGCPHRHRCNLKPSEQARSRMSSSLISDLRKRMQGASVSSAPAGEGATATVITPPAPEPAPSEAMSTPSVMGCSDKDVPEATEVPEALTKPFVSPGAINPPEASVAPPPVQAEAPKEEKPKAKRTRKTEAKDPLGADAHAATSVVESVALAKTAMPNFKEELEAAVGSNGAAKAEASGIIVANVTPEDAASLKKELEQARMAMTRGGFTLYVDCMPIGAPAKLASSFFEKANAAIDEVHKVPDYRLVDYGKGAPLFAASVLEQVLESGKDVILDTRTPEGAIVLEALASKASLVVRGLR